MNTSIFGDKIIVLWQVLAFGCILGSIFFLLPWFIGWLYRWRGVEPPSLDRRIKTCTLVVLITVFVSWFATHIVYAVILLLFVVFGEVVGAFRTSVEWHGPSVLLLAWIVSSVAISIILVRLFLSKSAKGHQWMLLPVAIGLALCVMGTHMCAMPSRGRMITLAKRAVVPSNLNGIGKGLILYHKEYGVYPDDLRRLVDHGQPEALLRSIYGSEKPHKPRTVPYDGPCDFVYIRLPADAPDNLVWAWQPVKYHDNEGGYVLFKSYNVRWMKAEQLKAEVARTHKWLETHPTTQPATAPAG